MPVQGQVYGDQIHRAANPVTLATAVRQMCLDCLSRVDCLNREGTNVCGWELGSGVRAVRVGRDVGLTLVSGQTYGQVYDYVILEYSSFKEIQFT